MRKTSKKETKTEFTSKPTKNLTNKSSLSSRKTLWIGITAIVLSVGYSFFLISCSQKENAEQADTSTNNVSLATYVGSKQCQSCHAEQQTQWNSSHHAQAIQEANAQTVLGNFNKATFRYNTIQSRFYKKGNDYFIETDGPDGKLTEYKVSYTFGVYPLQQYLVQFPGGRMQAIPIAWDSRKKEEGGQRWFHMYPDEKIDFKDQLHWTGPYQNWNMMCAECHSTALKKNWDPEQKAYHTEWKELSVGCESCHGPASGHIEWSKAASKETDAKKGFAFSLRSGWSSDWQFADNAPIAHRVKGPNPAIENVCAACHARSSQLTDGWNASPADEFTQHHNPAVLTEPLFWATGEQHDEVYVWNTFHASKMYANGVTCVDCHNAHTGKLLASDNSLCGRCHSPAVFDTPKHHFHQAATAGASCVSCHMPTRTYMGVDERRDHSFQVPRPDLSMTTQSPNACVSCHTAKNNQWAAKALDKWYGNEWRQRPHWANTFHQASSGKPNADQALMTLAKDTKQSAIVRASSLSLLRREARPEVIALAQLLMQDAAPKVRSEAVKLLETVEPGERWRLANALLDDANRMVRMETVAILADMPAEQLNDTDRQRWGRALGEYEQSLRLHSDFPSNSSQLGVLYLRQQRWNEARSWLLKAIELDRKFEAGYVNLADYYRLTKNDVLAVETLNKGLEFVPKGADLRYALALAYVRLGDVNQALPLLKEAIRLSPDNVQYAYVYAVALHDKAGPLQGIAALKQALEHLPNNGDLLSLLVEWLIETRNFAEARSYSEQYAGLYPNDPAIARWKQMIP
ncbi:tetratricopeptide repeat protein [Xanthocytophaga agilis]|uniref:Cytochrome c3 family protein n=1 Tax=Xanthocytophaga agilis TaxID=3048010 RepID=A0AAE3R093_9BACT|nr:tetratricopeptide repeat protein [Xanthocytophaga agilis]MDJ1501344.1 cytochrome c3 family protein [Xanthocytophaga agilis]